jgi:hypothetical protein
MFLLLAEAKDIDVMTSPIQASQFPGKILHMNPRTPINMRGIFVR